MIIILSGVFDEHIASISRRYLNGTIGFDGHNLKFPAPVFSISEQVEFVMGGGTIWHYSTGVKNKPVLIAVAAKGFSFFGKIKE